MNVLIITYDVDDDDRRDALRNAIKKLKNWKFVTESCYAVHTSLSVEALFDRFERHINEVDDLYILSIRGPWTGYGYKSTLSWLTNLLG